MRTVRDFAKLDVEREERTGIPEVVLAEGKRDDHLREIAEAFAEERGRLIVSRLDAERLAAFEGLDLELHYHEDARLLVCVKDGAPRRETGGRVAILAAGTSDRPAAEEARVVAEELGCRVRVVYDVGVAGIHRLYPELEWAAESDAIIVAAGREGALATVVSGLVDKPVIGLPVSTGYGLGGRGVAAVHSMLQSCSPMTVVNVDAGVVAGACAARIANTVARARGGAPPSARDDDTSPGSDGAGDDREALPSEQ